MLSNNNFKTLKPHQIWLPLLLAIFMVAGILIGMNLGGSSARSVGNDGISGTADKVGELLRYIDARYVDEVDEDELLEKAMESIMNQLDPHSGYIPADELKEENESLAGAFEGIGVEFMLIRDTVVVLKAINGGPSAAAGLKVGDKIIEVEGEVIAGVNLGSDDIIKKLKGERGTRVKIAILRNGDQTLREFTIQREEIPVHSVEAAYEIRPGVAYLKVERFSHNTFKDFIEAMSKLFEDEKPRDLILDLRQNHGGYLQQATRMLSQFFPETGALLAYTEGSHVDRMEYKSSGRAYFNIRNVAVLIDEGTASASEIVAGALQDHDRAIIIGRRSFGKGLVQEQYGLADGSAVRLTVSRYFLPSGRSIQKPIPDRQTYSNDLEMRMESGEYFDRMAMVPADSTPYYTADERLVYGSSGIWPDVFVPMDSVFLDGLTRQLYAVAPLYVYSNMDKWETIRDQYPTGADFFTDFRVDEAILNDYFDFAAAEISGFELVNKKAIRNLAAVWLKSYLASVLFEEEWAIRIMNEANEIILKALEVVAVENPLDKLETFYR